MQIHTAAAIFKSEIDKWVAEYLENQQKDPEAWPTEMQEEGWFEQLQFFWMQNLSDRGRNE